MYIHLYEGYSFVPSRHERLRVNTVWAYGISGFVARLVEGKRIYLTAHAKQQHRSGGVVVKEDRDFRVSEDGHYLAQSFLIGTQQGIQLEFNWKAGKVETISIRYITPSGKFPVTPSPSKKLALRRLDDVEKEFIGIIFNHVHKRLDIRDPLIYKLQDSLKHLHPEEPIVPVQVHGYWMLLYKTYRLTGSSALHQEPHRKACVCTR